MGDMFLQLFHLLQGHILGLGILQQSTYIKHVVQVCLNLHLQLLALCVPRLLGAERGEIVGSRQGTQKASGETQSSSPS